MAVGSSVPRFAAQLLTIRLLLSVLLCYGSSSSSSGSSNNVTNYCPKHERQALLHMIQEVKDAVRNHLLTDSWVVGTNCCQWYGIACDRRTGHVVRIDLRRTVPVYDGDYPYKLNLDRSLLALEHLRYVDLSGNEILLPAGDDDDPILLFIGPFQNLRYLNLSYIDFFGGFMVFPADPQLGNLSRLTTLSLIDSPFVIEDARWLSRRTSLRQVELTIENSVAGWFQALAMLPSIRVIRLTAIISGEGDIPSSLNTLNFTNLSVLDLYSFQFGKPKTMLPSWLSNLTRLQYLRLSHCNLGGEAETAFGYLSSSLTSSLEVLDLSSNQLQGSIPEDTFSGSKSMLRRLDLYDNNLSGSVPQSLGRSLSRLESLDLSYNNFSGSVPQSLGRQLSRLESLDLSGNNFSGSVPQSLGRLSRLVYLDLSGNSLTGSLTEAHFANLSSLKVMYMSNMNSHITLDVSSTWQPPFRLQEAYLSGCQIAGGRFPRWLRTQLQSLTALYISNTGIQDSIPRWFWIDNSSIVTLGLSSNAIFGDLPAALHSSRLLYIDLSSNNLHGPLPQLFNAPNLLSLDLSNNSFSGPITNIGSSNLKSLLLSKNNLTGEVPAFICQMDLLEILDLSHNHLTGELPDCHRPVFFQVIILDLSDNNLSGRIPDNLGSGDRCNLSSLYLSNNNFSGELPSSLTQCGSLINVLDLAYNELTGNITIWLGDILANLRTLKLRSNKFYGFLPPMSSKTQFQILDLSNNNLAGAIPPSFGSFQSMMTLDDNVDPIYNFDNFKDTVLLWMKGKEQRYDKLLKFVLAIDLSHNDLSGTIPEQLANLILLQSLNLSNNHLTGEITTKIGRMKHLESLDLSYNTLSGPIPPSLAKLDSLGDLDLSYNNLSGRIPTGGHLDTFQNPSVYKAGNPFLITEEHGGDTTTEGAFVGENTDEDIDEKFWLYNSIAPGFVVGFWAVLGPLLFKKTWRYAYFRAMDAMHDKILCRQSLC